MDYSNAQWFACRTLPGAQMPKREYWAEKTERGKGYHIRSGVASDYSAVELALKDNGFVYYMPCEFACIRDRNKAGAYRLRRFALLKGYIFVGERDEASIGEVVNVPGIRGIVSNWGKPFAISPMDLFQLRLYEARSRSQAEHKVKQLSTAEDRLVREKKKFAIRNAKKKLFPGRDVNVIWGDKTGRAATVEAWEDQDKVRVLLQALEQSTETITVPYEFLKIA